MSFFHGFEIYYLVQSSLILFCLWLMLGAIAVHFATAAAPSFLDRVWFDYPRAGATIHAGCILIWPIVVLVVLFKWAKTK